MLAQNINYSIIPFDNDNLALALSNDWVNPEEIKNKMHYKYFSEYLSNRNDGLNAHIILIEENYISQSFLSDYADYYSRGFASYSRICKRIHFFSSEFSEEVFNNALIHDNEESESLWKSYLGYIVVKQLPATPIGATLLKPYSNGENKLRHYPVRRPYSINILGKQVTLETLVFQEQDVNVSACATTALWMAFHKTAFLFQTPLPSPYQITASTGNLFQSTGRNFPNKGLDLYQVGKAIESVGLVAELRLYQNPLALRAQITDPNTLQITVNEQIRQAKAFIYAYLKMGLPVLFFIQLQDLGGHLVTVTGYREAASSAIRSTQISLVSDGIERIYIHDDQMGPFSRLGFTADGMLETGWPENGDWTKNKLAVLDAVSVPLIPDIRIEYEQVYRQAALFDQILYSLIGGQEAIVWDIHLNYSNKYKSELKNDIVSEDIHLQRILKKLLPKYIWVARAKLANNVIIEMIFDATDLHTGFYCKLINLFEPLRTPFKQWISQQGAQQNLLNSPGFNAEYLKLILSDLEIQ